MSRWCFTSTFSIGHMYCLLLIGYQANPKYAHIIDHRAWAWQDLDKVHQINAFLKYGFGTRQVYCMSCYISIPIPLRLYVSMGVLRVLYRVGVFQLSDEKTRPNFICSLSLRTFFVVLCAFGLGFLEYVMYTRVTVNVCF